MNICQYCNSREANQIHHIFYGNGIKPISDEYKLIIPLCHICHDFIQFRQCSKRQTQIELCQKIGIDKSLFIKLNQIMRRNARYWNNKDLNFMINIKYYLEHMEVKNEKNIDLHYL